MFPIVFMRYLIDSVWVDRKKHLIANLYFISESCMKTNNFKNHRIKSEISRSFMFKLNLERVFGLWCLGLAICLVLCDFMADSDLKTLKHWFLFASSSSANFSLHGKWVSFFIPKWIKRPFFVPKVSTQISHLKFTCKVLLVTGLDCCKGCL